MLEVRPPVGLSHHRTSDGKSRTSMDSWVTNHARSSGTSVFFHQHVRHRKVSRHLAYLKNSSHCAPVQLCAMTFGVRTPQFRYTQHYDLIGLAVSADARSSHTVGRVRSGLSSSSTQRWRLTFRCLTCWWKIPTYLSFLRDWLPMNPLKCGFAVYVRWWLSPTEAELLAWAVPGNQGIAQTTQPSGSYRPSAHQTAEP